MKKTVTILLLLQTFVLAQLHTVVSIQPEVTFLKAIGGDKVDVTLMVMPGNSPHTYEPRPSQMQSIANAQLYFAIGVEFEKVWLPKFKALNPSMRIVDLSEKIEKLPIAHTPGVATHTHTHHSDEGLDPHIWTSPANVAIMAHQIHEALCNTDPANEAYYTKHLHTFLAHIEATDKKIRTLLSKRPKGSSFMVFHPSWGYFAKTYNLRQLPVEVEGRSPSPKALIAIIEEAKAQKVTALFTQPEFSDTAAQIIAHELQIPVIKVTPLAKAWAQNLIRIAKAIAGEQ